MDENRILDKLDDIADRMARVETTVSGLSVCIDKYNDVTSRTTKLEMSLTGIWDSISKCQGERAEAGKRRAIPWGAIAGSILSGITVGLIMFGLTHWLQ